MLIDNNIYKSIHSAAARVSIVGLATVALFSGCSTRPGLGPKPADEKTIGIPAASSARSGHADTFATSELDEPLRQLKFVKPNIPGHLWAKRQNGTVELEFTILEDGSVADVVVVSATHKDFGISAASAVSQWRFSTPIKDGKPTRIQARQVMPFWLR